MARLPGIFCLEGGWAPNLRARDTVQPLLQLLEHLRISVTIHRDVATREEFEYYLKRWAQKGYSDFQTLYLATHGGSGDLHLGKDSVTLEDLAEMLHGKAKGRVIYFGSCLTLNLHDEDLRHFAAESGAKAVIGYSAEIPWLETAAFELLLLERIARGNRSDAFFNHLTKDHGSFAKELGLVVATKTRVMDA